MAFPLTLTPVGDRNIRVERAFAAPPARLWRALTEPALLLQWQGMPSHPIIEAEVDLRVGGRWRWAWRHPSGNLMVASGEYLLLDAPHRMIHTELFEEDWTDGPTTITTDLIPTEAGTRMVADILYTGPRGRDMAMASGMEHGMHICYDQLAALLAP
ncbi:MAG: ATPase [Rhodobacterales bacterium]|nr:ATPase [Rhodobacterales bacterium]